MFIFYIPNPTQNLNLTISLLATSVCFHSCSGDLGVNILVRIQAKWSCAYMHYHVHITELSKPETGLYMYYQTAL